jgi:hypothetical protein
VARYDSPMKTAGSTPAQRQRREAQQVTTLPGSIPPFGAAGRYAVRMVIDNPSTPERRQEGARRLLAMCDATPRVKTAAKGITAEVRRMRDRNGIAG